MLYTLAAGATIACSLPANAEVLFTRSNAVVTGNSGALAIDMDHDGVTDFTLSEGYVFGGTSTYGELSWALELNGAPPNQVGIRRTAAAALKKGELIGSGDHNFSPFGVMAEVSVSDGSTAGYFFHCFNRYIGVKLVINGEVHYGWVGFRSVQDFVATLGGWAYETQLDTPIRAGDMGTLGTESIDLTQPTSLGMLAKGHSAAQNWRSRVQKIAH